MGWPCRPTAQVLELSVLTVDSLFAVLCAGQIYGLGSRVPRPGAQLGGGGGVPGEKNQQQSGWVEGQMREGNVVCVCVCARPWACVAVGGGGGEGWVGRRRTKETLSLRLLGY